MRLYNLCERCLKSKDIVKHEIYECLAPPCKICKDSHHTLICRFEKKGMKHVESQVERRHDDDSFDGPDSTRSDKKYTYDCMPRNNESNEKEVVKYNKEGNPNLKDEDVSETWEVEIAKDALETIGDQDILLKGKAKEAMKEAVIENKSIIEMKPLEGEKKHKSMGEERTPLTNCKERHSSLPLAYLDKVKWFKSLIPQLGSEVEETTPVEIKAASDIKSKETSSEPEEITIKDEIEVK